VAHFLVTGHTGFKGSWLTVVLRELGHTVSGMGLDPLPGTICDRYELSSLLAGDYRADIRDLKKVRDAFQSVAPDFVVHLAAQAIVMEGYRDPVGTYETNVFGTLNILRAIDEAPSVKGALIITTDKVYSNDESGRFFVESDALGGSDPYSNSKAMADLLAQEWMARPAAVPAAVLRAGNVIGFGDTSPHRLIPDLIGAAISKSPVVLRRPDAVRPWQHVLDCLAGYLKVLDYLANGGESTVWNIGPPEANYKTVSEVTKLSRSMLSPISLEVVEAKVSSEGSREAGDLRLSSEKAAEVLKWENVLQIEEAIDWSLVGARESKSELTLKLLESQTKSFLERTNLSFRGDSEVFAT